jgi:hypothetical protein
LLVIAAGCAPSSRGIYQQVTQRDLRQSRTISGLVSAIENLSKEITQISLARLVALQELRFAISAWAE